MKLRKRIRLMLAGPRLYRALVVEKNWHQLRGGPPYNPAVVRRVELNALEFRERAECIQEVLRKL